MPELPSSSTPRLPLLFSSFTEVINSGWGVSSKGDGGGVLEGSPFPTPLWQGQDGRECDDPYLSSLSAIYSYNYRTISK